MSLSAVHLRTPRVPTRWTPNTGVNAEHRSVTLLRPSVRPLLALAAGSSATRTWPLGGALVSARNAHYTNTVEELRAALVGDANWLEGDLRLDDDGRLVMAHDRGDEQSGLAFAEWLHVGGVSGRGLKVDVKEVDAVGPLLAMLERSGVPQGRLMVNVGEVAETVVVDIRRRLPDAWIALTPTLRRGGYDAVSLARIARLARAAGGRIAFPIRWDRASDEVIAFLRRFGRVSVWTSRSGGTPPSAALEGLRLRTRGVDGVIDLGPPSNALDRAWQALVRAGLGLADAWHGAQLLLAPGAAARRLELLLRDLAGTVLTPVLVTPSSARPRRGVNPPQVPHAGPAFATISAPSAGRRGGADGARIDEVERRWRTP